MKVAQIQARKGSWDILNLMRGQHTAQRVTGPWPSPPQDPDRCPTRHQKPRLRRTCHYCGHPPTLGQQLQVTSCMSPPIQTETARGDERGMLSASQPGTASCVCTAAQGQHVSQYDSQ